MARKARAAAQVAAHGGDEREVVDHLDLERLDLLLDIAHQRVERIVHLALLHHGAKAVHARGHVLDTHAIALEHREGAAHKAHARLGAVARHVDGHEVALAGNARDDRLLLALVGGLADDGARVLGGVGVLDHERDPRLAHREHGLLVQHARTHVGKLAQLLVGDARDGAGIGNDARIGREEARDVRPVLVEVGAEALGEDGARDISAAAVEQLDLALLGGAVEAGHHEAALVAALLHELGGAAHGERAVVVEGHDVLGVEERQTKILGHEAGGKVLAARDELLGGVAAGAGTLGKGAEFIADRVGKAELVGDIEVALADVVEQLVARHVVFGVRVHEIQQVGNLGVVLKAAAACRDHHKTACGVGIDDGFDFFEMFGIGDR